MMERLSIKESLHMLSMARRQGITDVFATSHYSAAASETEIREAETASG
ncbi:MAG: hypothetical protein ACLU00_10575 [Mediterraneibacter faecis]